MVVVEGTAGNTGISLTLVGNACGYRSVIVILEIQGKEKMDILRLCGAKLMAVPYRDPKNDVKVSERVAAEYAEKEPEGALWATQWDKLTNCRAHYETKGPAIWCQTGGL